MDGASSEWLKKAESRASGRRRWSQQANAEIDPRPGREEEQDAQEPRWPRDPSFVDPVVQGGEPP